MSLKPCRHLDYEDGKYDDCTIETPAYFPSVRYWARGERWTDGGKNPRNVQFCGAGRGRINSIFACYNGEMSCYEPAPDEGETQ